MGGRVVGKETGESYDERTKDSENAIFVIAGVILIDLLAAERKRLYAGSTSVVGT